MSRAMKINPVVWQIKNLVIVLLVVGLVWCSCASRSPNQVEIVILSFNDLHGDFKNLAKLSTLVQETKSKHKHVIVVDAGDRFTGNSYNDFYEEREFPIIDLENQIGVDVAAIGNHEFDYGKELLQKRVKQSEFVEISANVETAGTALADIVPYHVIEKDGIKIAFLGLTNVDRHTGKPAVLAERVKDIQFYDPIETALKYKHLRKESQVLIALSHIGFDIDTLLAQEMPEFDLIVGAHSHTFLEQPFVCNHIPILQAETSANYVWKTTITLEKGIITKQDHELIQLRDQNIPEDSNITKKIRKYEENTSLKKTVVTLNNAISGVDRLASLLSDAILSLPDVEISVTNCASVRVDHLPAGPVSFAKILQLYPFSNYIVIADLTPAKIRKLIEEEFLEKKNCLMVPAGFEYVAQRNPQGGIKVLSMKLSSGKPMKEDQVYRLGINNYLFSRYLLNHIEQANFTSISIVDNLIEYLKNNPDENYQNATSRAKYNP